jgi:branched-chain amino acid transport system ATP-binding protein
MARCGITRTFQSVRLFGELSVIDNVMVGFHLQLKCGFFAQLLQTRAAVTEEAAFSPKGYSASGICRHR